jgi:hypothetical protein
LIILGPIGEDGGIEQFATGAAFPGVEGTDEIVILLCVHPASAFWTFHGSLLYRIEWANTSR